MNYEKLLLHFAAPPAVGTLVDCLARLCLKTLLGCTAPKVIVYVDETVCVIQVKLSKYFTYISNIQSHFLDVLL